MKAFRQAAVGLCLWAAAVNPATASGPRVSVGFQFGVPAYHRHYHGYHGYHGGWGPYPYFYYRPSPVIIERPVVVQPAPVVVEQPPQVFVQPRPVVPQTYAEPMAAPLPALTATPVSATSSPAVDTYLQQLSNPDERVRGDAVLELGRLKADRAVDPLAATLASDRSPAVRETAARALGLIASPRALTALTHAAQADGDRDVRRSAQFAVEIIQANQRR